MARNQKDHVAGALGILAAVAYLCLQGMKKVDARLKKKAEKK